jgi:enoyl-[acyl-carrier-protein] reductase (NADH)
LAFQKELEAQLQEYKSKHLQTDFSEEINVRKDTDMKEIKQKVEEKKLDSIDFIVQNVLSVHLE